MLIEICGKPIGEYRCRRGKKHDGKCDIVAAKRHHAEPPCPSCPKPEPAPKMTLEQLDAKLDAILDEEVGVVPLPPKPEPASAGEVGLFHPTDKYVTEQHLKWSKVFVEDWERATKNGTTDLDLYQGIASLIASTTRSAYGQGAADQRKADVEALSEACLEYEVGQRDELVSALSSPTLTSEP